jgi:hypothetical protein
MRQPRATGGAGSSARFHAAKPDLVSSATRRGQYNEAGEWKREIGKRKLEMVRERSHSWRRGRLATAIHAQPGAARLKLCASRRDASRVFARHARHPAVLAGPLHRRYILF